MSTQRPRIAGPLIWASISSLGTQVLAFLTFALLARLLGTETFGLVALAALVIDVLQVTTVAGISEAVVQRQTLSDEDIDTAFWSNLAVGIVLFAGTLLAAPFVASFYSQPELAPLMSALAVMFILTPLGAIHTARLTRELRFRSIAMRNLGAAVAGAAVGLPLAFADFGAWALVAQRITAAAVMVVVVWFAFPWRPRLRFSGKTFLELLSFGGFLTASSLLTQLNSRTAEFMSGLYVGPVAIAFMRSGARVIEMLQQLTLTPIQQISMPLQARAQYDPEARRSSYAELSQISAFMMFPAFLGCAALAEPIVQVVFGPGWDDAAVAIMILAAAVAPIQMNTLILSALTATGHTRANLIWSALQFPLTVLLIWLAVPYGWPAMLAAGILRSYLLLPVGLLLLRHYTSIAVRPVLRSILPAAVSALAMFGAVFSGVQALQGTMPAMLMLVTGPMAGGVIYIAIYWLLDRAFFQRLHDLVRARRSQGRATAVTAGGAETG